MESSNHIGQIPIILGRPFLATANACINCRTGVMDVSFGNKKMRLNIFSTSQGTPVYNHDEVNMIEEVIKLPLDFDPLQDCLKHFDINNFNIEEYTQEVNLLLEPFKFDTTPSWTEKYQPSTDLSMLEAPQLQPLGNLTHSVSTATSPRITTSDQENQLTIGWTFTKPKEVNLSEAKPQTANLHMRTLSKEHVGPQIINTTDKLTQTDLPHKPRLSLKHTEEQDFTPHKLFRGNITKFKPTIKGSSYFPT